MKKLRRSEDVMEKMYLVLQGNKHQDMSFDYFAWLQNMTDAESGVCCVLTKITTTGCSCIGI